MPALTRPRREVFAQAIARGGNPEEAAREAGFRTRAYGARVAKAKKVVERVEEIRRRMGRGGSGEVEALIDDLWKTAEQARGLGTAPGMVAANGAFAQIARLKQHLDASPAQSASQAAILAELDRDMSDEEWTARYGPEAPGGKIGDRGW